MDVLKTCESFILYIYGFYIYYILPSILHAFKRVNFADKLESD